MFGIAEIASGLTSIKAARDILQGLDAAKTQLALDEATRKLREHITNAQEGLLSAQEAEFASTKRIAELEEQIVQFENWTAQKKRYELQDTGQGTLAYRLKEGMEEGEPPHWICPNCYENGKRSILKSEHISAGRTEHLVCHPCGLDIMVQGVRYIKPSSGT